MGLTVMVSAESSQSISFSLPLSWSLMVRWCAARIRNTPRMIINTRKLTHTTMTMVAALGTTAAKRRRNKNHDFERTDFICNVRALRRQIKPSYSCVLLRKDFSFFLC